MPSDALNVLFDIKSATFANAASLPLKEQAAAQWQGLGFLVGGVRLVAKLGEVGELLQVPRLTTLPAVKPWVRGIANIRGRLVPIIDLHSFLGLPTTLPASQWRVLFRPPLLLAQAAIAMSCSETLDKAHEHCLYYQCVFVAVCPNFF